MGINNKARRTAIIGYLAGKDAALISDRSSTNDALIDSRKATAVIGCAACDDAFATSQDDPP
ncbi:hypothetical protein ASAP_3139 [Asaia bogorensis]|uniref:Uncharacterized protein n=1 Tax=Asaia bogorensis TaxID=91915 RepID=A0A060QJ65_9PROT|nr:hypothetical protein ASAP_3139 [Asaia bogorensis]